MEKYALDLRHSSEIIWGEFWITQQTEYVAPSPAFYCYLNSCTPPSGHCCSFPTSPTRYKTFLKFPIMHITFFSLMSFSFYYIILLNYHIICIQHIHQLVQKRVTHTQITLADTNGNKLYDKDLV